MNYFNDIEEFKDVLKDAKSEPVHDYGYSLHVEKPTMTYHKKNTNVLKCI